MTKNNAVAPAIDKSAYHYEPLLETESSVMYFLAEPSITTTTFFKSVDYPKSLEMISKRITLICHANPWLLGRLEKDKTKHKNVLLAFPKIILDQSDVDEILCSTDLSLSKISSDTPYEELGETISKSTVAVKEGYKLVGTGSRVAKFSLIPVANGQVALFFSITHAVSDGHTYYKIFNMLTEGTEIESLSFTRKHTFIPKMKEAIGEAEMKLLLSPGLMINFVSRMLCGTKAKFHAKMVDQEKVSKAKQSAAGRCKVSEEEFVCSTNDILTSAFANATNADILLMAINFRNRVDDARDNDAGNYEAVLTFDSASCNTPELIRESLRKGVPYKRTSGIPLPGFFKAMKINLSIITNWAFPSFKADLKLASSTSINGTCAIQLHLPFYPPEAAILPFAVIFRPSFGKLAVMFAGSPRDLSIEKLMQSGAPLGNNVNEHMFNPS